MSTALHITQIHQPQNSFLSFYSTYQYISPSHQKYKSNCLYEYYQADYIAIVQNLDMRTTLLFSHRSEKHKLDDI